MSRATLIVDGECRMDDELDEWHRRPPQLLADMIKPGSKPEPYLVAAGMALADATVKGQPVRVTITTRPSGYNVDVDLA